MNLPDLRTELATLHEESFTWALRCCRGDATSASDVLQEAYYKILAGRARFDNRSSFKTWLLALIRLTAADEWRRTGRRYARLATLAAEPELFAEPPDAALTRTERHDGLRVALTALSPRQQEVLTLVFFHDLSIAEAAAVMNVSLGSARTHYERAKQQLREIRSLALL